MGSKQPERDVGPPLMLTYKEAARYTGVSLSKLYILMRAGVLHSLDLGPQTKRIARSECEEYVRSLAAGQIREAS